MKGMWKKLDEVLYESARNGWPIFEQDLSRGDDDIVTTFDNSDVLKTTTEKIELDIETFQLLELMGEPLPRLTPVTLQQGDSQDPTKNPTFWYHERMLPNWIALEVNLSQIRERLEELRHIQDA